jgi:hypothetical protein
VAVLAKMRKVHNKRVVVYSSFFERGIQLFSKFLTSKNLQHVMLTPKSTDVEEVLKDFEQGNMPIILLHPDYTHGLSIRGARQLHVLEPLLSFAQQQQLVARVSRFQSHDMLPMQQRNVAVFFWYASMQGVMGWLRKHAEGMLQWSYQQPYTNYFMRTLDFAQDLTPDALVLQETNNLLEISTELKIVKEFNRNTKKQGRSQCCVWEPDQRKLTKCLQAYSGMYC